VVEPPNSRCVGRIPGRAPATGPLQFLKIAIIAEPGHCPRFGFPLATLWLDKGLQLQPILSIDATIHLVSGEPWLSFQAETLNKVPAFVPQRGRTVPAIADHDSPATTHIEAVEIRFAATLMISADQHPTLRERSTQLALGPLIRPFHRAEERPGQQEGNRETKHRWLLQPSAQRDLIRVVEQA
jgi:hypothetical protein